ncbi:hypothetical protein G7054_g2676 [Neopestalotiopsis clavispora]|nr:hypothetical protein G7054_g2676 [Neopestalotiopsis clavispora]
MPPIFTVGWVCALPDELAAAWVVMDERYEPVPSSPTDTNVYRFGRIGVHDVVAACLPAGQIGTNSAAVVASHMRNSFPSLRFVLLVGIGGGVPSDEHDIRLGDVVISQPVARHGGVVQFDFGKTMSGGEFTRTGSLNAPPSILLSALSNLRADISLDELHIREHLSAFSGKERFACPGSEKDVLYSATSKHVPGSTCALCREEDIIVRQARATPDPFLFFGTIASADQAVKDAPTRDRFSRELGSVLCFETEAAGLMNNFECLVVRGICDYADAHKNKRWQLYAAATAAAYAKELLLLIPQNISATGNSQIAHVTLAAHSTVSSLSDEGKDCLRSLAFPEQESRSQEIHFAQKTCQWLLMDNQYREWTKNINGLFWIKGSPGSGKSALMKFAATVMRSEQPADLVVSYFIHSRGTDLQKSLLGVFRALLNTILASFPQHLSRLTKVFNDREARYGSYQEERWSWASQELRECMLETLSKGAKDRPVIIFIDSLDECGEHDAKALLSFFEDLMQQVEMERAKVKICFSSRHYPILGSNTIPTVSVEEQNGMDIRLVVHERLKQLASERSRQQIEERILSISRGGFQWAVLVTDQILHAEMTGMKKTRLLRMLIKFPRTLDGLYGDILRRSNGAQREQMVKLFQWILFARRPLSSQELREALATDTASATFNSPRRHDCWVEDLSQFEKYVKNLSRGLVEFQERDVWEQYEPDGELWNREAQFIHRSVPDYLIEKFLPRGEKDRVGSRAVAGAAHFELSRSCCRYITMGDVWYERNLPRSRLSMRYPLAPYAVQYLFHHIRKVEQAGLPQLDLLSLIQWDRRPVSLQRLADLWNILDPGTAHAPKGWPFIEATSLHILIAFGSESGLEAVLQKETVAINALDSQGNTPLLLAVREDHPEMALMLLERSYEWNHRQDRTVEEVNNRSPDIDWQRKHVVNVNAENYDGDTAIHMALTSSKNGELIFRLLQAGADLKHSVGETALILYAVKNRNRSIFMHVIQQDFNLDEAINSVLWQLVDEDEYGIFEPFLSDLLKDDANAPTPALSSVANLVDAFNIQRKDDIETEQSFATQPDEDDYIEELAGDLYSHILDLVDDTNTSIGALEDEQTWNQVLASLPELLEDFALSAGHQASRQRQRDIMVFIHKNRQRITEKLREAHISDHSPSSISDHPPSSSRPEDKLDIWVWMEGVEDVNQGKSPAPPSNNDFGSINEESNEIVDRSLDEYYDVDEYFYRDADSEGSETNVGNRVQMFRRFVQSLSAYKWLQSCLQRAFLMTSAEKDILADIRQGIVYQLPDLQRFSSRKSSVTYKAAFQVKWSPSSFLGQQGYLGDDQGEAIANALTLTGTTGNAQAMPCAEYLCKTWPITGKVLLRLIMEIVSGEDGVKYAAKLFDNTEVSVRADASQLVVKVSGTRNSIAEIAEQLAWLGSALPVRPRQSNQSASTYCFPNVRLDDSPKQSVNNLAFVIEFEAREQDNQKETSIGQCWTNLIKNRVLVQGYPIFRRPKPDSGLEVALNIISWLVQAPYATIFDGRVFIKGSRSMLVLTEHTKHAFIWHLLEYHDGSSITYNDPRVPLISSKKIPRFDLKELASSRHFLGWCEKSESFVGKPNTNYVIQFSGMHPDLDCPSEQRTIYPGFPIKRRKGVSIPRSDNATNHRSAPEGSYLQRLRNLEKVSVALFDSNEKRSWLVDGASALLHLVRATVPANKDAFRPEDADHAFRQQYKFQWKEARDPGSTPSSNASVSILMNQGNREQILFHEMTEAESKEYYQAMREPAKGGQVVDRLDQEKSETFEQRVDKISCFLDLAFQNEENRNETRKSYASLEGFEFREIAAATVKASRCSTKLPSEGGASIQLCRQLNAVTLFGEGFGDLIKPILAKDDDLCKNWKIVPHDKGYICVQMSYLQQILNTTKERHRLWDYVKSLWNQPEFSFRKKCACGKEDPCNYAQMLQGPDQFVGVKGDTVDKASIDGAMIFGPCPHPSDESIQFESSSTHGSLGSYGNSNTTASHNSSRVAPSTTQYTEPSHSQETPIQDLEFAKATDPATSQKSEVIHHQGIQATNQPPDGDNQQFTIESNHESNHESNSIDFALYGMIVMGCFAIENFYWTTFSLSLMLFILLHNKWKPARAWVRFVKHLCVAALLVWLIVLSPLHVLLPTLLDFWTPYQATFDSPHYEIIYDRGDLSSGNISVEVQCFESLGFSRWIQYPLAPRHTPDRARSQEYQGYLA